MTPMKQTASLITVTPYVWSSFTLLPKFALACTNSHSICFVSYFKWESDAWMPGRAPTTFRVLSDKFSHCVTQYPKFAKIIKYNNGNMSFFIFSHGRYQCPAHYLYKFLPFFCVWNGCFFDQIDTSKERKTLSSNEMRWRLSDLLVSCNSRHFVHFSMTFCFLFVFQNMLIRSPQKFSAKLVNGYV